jgi:hypothetical protein
MALLRDSHAGGADTSPITVRTHPIGELQPNGLIDSVPTTGGRPPSLRAPDEPHSGLVVPGLPAERAVCRTCPPRGQKRSRRARSANDWFRRVRSSYAITLSPNQNGLHSLCRYTPSKVGRMGRRSGGAAIARDVESNRFGPVEKGSDAMSGFQNLSGTLANDDAWRHRVAGCDARHNGSVSDTKIVDPMDLERAVHHRHRVVSHLGSTCLMPIAACS